MSRESAASSSEPPAQRRRLTEGNFGEPDVILTSNEGNEYPAHSKYLQTACEVFDDLFELAKSDATEGNLPSIPLHETSDIIELILPLVYRKSASSLRSQPYSILASCLKLAHRLGMPLVVDHIAIFLEKHIEDHASEIYPLACRFDLAELETRSEEAFKASMDMSDPFALADLVGTERARRLYKGSLRDHRNGFQDLVVFRSALAESRDDSIKCKAADCPGVICQKRDLRRELEVMSILSRYIDFKERLDMACKAEESVLNAHRQYIEAQIVDYDRVGKHQKKCPAFKFVTDVLDGDADETD